MTKAEFAELYDAHAPLVRSVLMRLAPPANLDDLTQETFLKAWRARDEFQGRAQAKTWLCRIARNAAIDARRAMGERMSVGVEHLEHKQAPGMRPDDRALLEDLLARMDPDDRLLLLLVSVEQCTMQEIAEILGVPAGTVKSRTFSLRQRLREEMEQKGAA
jgi:RNA polymerase sigma-70 factor (ECF subfamily)